MCPLQRSLYFNLSSPGAFETCLFHRAFARCHVLNHCAASCLIGLIKADVTVELTFHRVPSDAG